MTPPVASFSSLLPAISLLLVHISPVSGTEAHIQIHRSGIIHPPVDKSLLAIQVGSIVASYVIFVAILLGLVLFVGRRLRRTVQSSNFSLQMEMLNPVKPPVSMDPSPITPITQNLPSPSKSSIFTSWGSIPRGSRPSHASMNGSMVTVDESVIASDRQRADDEMERLYAAVMEHDAQKAAGVNVSSVRHSDSQTGSPDSQYTNPFTDRAASQVSVAAAPPVPPKSPRHTNRLSKLFSSKLATPSNPDAGRLKSPRLPMPIRKLGISSPLASPDVHASSSYANDQQPLSPRLYIPGPPPSAPNAPGSSFAPRQGIPLGQVMSPRIRTRVPPAPLTLTTTTPTTASPSQPKSSSLPFRDAYPQQSAPATKTTFLERPVKRNGPVTGMPTPYTPYMPFTPVTPFTPGRTVTRRQRKREEKGNGLRVLHEDDLVKDEGDMWG
ncbi:hypothetical protein N7478_004231 [Penicillium angulare]|uniref:uncharacterized protein n=1 Tax=Penicillium angulare TaxID=116970 RepID=UPI0025405965|nr:uncharacterized protein N7478_004231 [Penicillium angulare]KAJ5278859.1 hypothetical protein N7478_004231 [Penicillium angulare]